MTTVTIEEAQAKLKELIHQMTPGSEVVITEKNLPVAKLVMPQSEMIRPIPGRGKGILTILSDDDEHLEDFKEYMP